MILTLKLARRDSSYWTKEVQNVRDTAEFYLPETCEMIRLAKERGVTRVFAEYGDLHAMSGDAYKLIGMVVHYAKLHGVDIIFVPNYDEAKERYGRDKNPQEGNETQIDEVGSCFREEDESTA